MLYFSHGSLLYSIAFYLEHVYVESVLCASIDDDCSAQDLWRHVVLHPRRFGEGCIDVETASIGGASESAQR